MNGLSDGLSDGLFLFGDFSFLSDRTGIFSAQTSQLALCSASAVYNIPYIFNDHMF